VRVKIVAQLEHDQLTPSGLMVMTTTQPTRIGKTTANHHLISSGLVYPTYYRALFPDLRNELTNATAQARAAGRGVWPEDRTTSGADVDGLGSLENECRHRA
jgi:endonuclease YncB( thermonuclease family)